MTTDPNTNDPADDAAESTIDAQDATTQDSAVQDDIPPADAGADAAATAEAPPADDSLSEPYRSSAETNPGWYAAAAAPEPTSTRRSFSSRLPRSRGALGALAACVGLLLGGGIGFAAGAAFGDHHDGARMSGGYGDHHRGGYGDRDGDGHGRGGPGMPGPGMPGPGGQYGDPDQDAQNG